MLVMIFGLSLSYRFKLYCCVNEGRSVKEDHAKNKSLLGRLRVDPCIPPLHGENTILEEHFPLHLFNLCGVSRYTPKCVIFGPEAPA